MPTRHQLRLLALSLVVSALSAQASYGVELTVSDSNSRQTNSIRITDYRTDGVSSEHEFSLVDYPDPVVEAPHARTAQALGAHDGAVIESPVTGGPSHSPAPSYDNASMVSDSYGRDCGVGSYGCGETACGPSCGSSCGPSCGSGHFFDDCSCGQPCCGGCGSGQTGFFVDGWLAQGITGNEHNPASGFNTPLTFNDQANEYQMNQLYMSFGRKVAASPDAWDVGGTIDVLYGTDYFFTQAAGLETNVDGSPHWNSDDGDRDGGNAAIYGVALPQAYAEIYAPLMGGVNIKLGHFYTTLGFEDVRAPRNFFYSHAYTMQYGEPFTHTGMLATFNFGPNLDAHFGVTRGWDNWEDANGKPGYLAGATLCANNRSSLAFALHTGREDLQGVNDRTVYSMVYTRRVNQLLTYVIQHDFGMETNAEIDDTGQPDDAKWYGINQYFLYDVSDALAMGLRVEWFRDQDNARVIALPLEGRTLGGNYSAVTLGANWKPTTRLLVRPELRWDNSDVRPFGMGGMFNDFTDDSQFTFGTDVIFRF